MPYIDEPSYRFDEPMAQDEWEMLQRPQGQTPMQKWWSENMKPLTDELDRLLNNPYATKR